jgi:hypothetical protein
MSVLTDTKLVAQSGNSKTGPIPVTYRTDATCPTTCPLLPTNGGGCYASGRLFALARKWTDDITFEEAVAVLNRAPRNATLLRDRVVGDLVTADGEFDWQYIETITAAAQAVGLKPFGYTHAWRLLTAADVQRIKALGYALNASCETEQDVLDATALGLPTVLAGDSWTDGQMIGERRVVTCLETTRNLNCAACGLCATDRAAVVRFPVHGSARGRARNTLAALVAA